MASTGKIRGIFTPNVVPLTDRGEIHEGELRKYVDWLIAKGVHGLYPNGSTGEFLRFTPEERRQIMEIVVDQVAGRIPILAGAAEANVRETIRACEAYHRLGATAVAIVSPFYYRLSPRAVYAYFKEIADHSPIDVTLYNIPLFASPIDVPTVQRLAEECPRVVGIKDSSGDVAHMMRLIAAVRPLRPDFSFMTGWDPVLLPMIMMGCDGGTNASSGVVPELTRMLYDSIVAQRYDDARRLQYDLMRLFDAMIPAGEFPDGFRAGVRYRGFCTGSGRQPLTSEQQFELHHTTQQLASQLRGQGYEAGASACATSPSDDVREVGEIVKAVMQELQRRGVRSA